MDQKLVIYKGSQMPAVELKKMTGLTNLSEIRIFEANSNEQKYPKIRDIKNFNIFKESNFIDQISRWRLKIGFRMKDDYTEKELENIITSDALDIYDTLKNSTEFNKLNAYDIHRCVDLTMEGKLGDPELYGMEFNSYYVTRLLRQYLKLYKNKIITKAKNNIMLQESVQKPTKRQLLEFKKENIRILWNSRNESTFYDGGFLAYSLMMEDSSFNISDDLKEESMEYGKKMANKEFADLAKKQYGILTSTKQILDYKRSKSEKYNTLILRYARAYPTKIWLNSIDDIEVYLKNKFHDYEAFLLANEPKSEN